MTLFWLAIFATTSGLPMREAIWSGTTKCGTNKSRITNNGIANGSITNATTKGEAPYPPGCCP